MIENLLSTCGLNSTEQIVFLHLFERGESIASLLSKQLNFKRTTVYAALDALVHYGIVARRKREGVTYFSSLPPQMVAKILENRARQKFDDVHSATRLLQTQLEGLLPKEQDFGGFEISTFESIEAVYLQLAETLAEGDFNAFFNPQVAVPNEKFEKLVGSFLKATAKSKANIREIVVSGPKTEWYKKQIKNPNHLIKEIGPEEAFFSDIILFKNHVVLNNYDPKQEVGIKIREKHLYQSLLTLFNWMWKRI